MPRLQLLCDRFLRLLRAGETVSWGREALDSGGDKENSSSSFWSDAEMPPPTLARDLSALVGDPEFADVRFIAEGRAIVAHRFILESRCEYFRAMFRSGMQEGGGGMVDVVVPGKHNMNVLALEESSNFFISVVVTIYDTHGYKMNLVFLWFTDTFVGFLRLLIFLYTGTLPDGSDGALLEDLMAADRFAFIRVIC